MENNKSILKLEYQNEIINIEQITKDEYRYTFSKSLSNVKNEADLLPLSINLDSHIKMISTFETDNIIFKYYLNNNMKEFKTLKKMKIHEKLHVLKNISKILDNRSQGYTYILNPDNIFYDNNNIPSILYVGYLNLLTPLKQDENDILFQFKCLITYLFDDKYDFIGLYNGGLDIVKKTKFLNDVYEAKDINALIDLLNNSFEAELNDYNIKNTIVNKKNYNILRFGALFTAIVCIISTVLLVNAYFKIIPYNNKMIDASYHYVSNDYGRVISTLKNEDANSLPQSHKYMLAYSYIKAEIMNDASKESALDAISTKSDSSYLLFWIYIGREDYLKADEISKELNDPKLEYHASYRAIEIIKEDRSISGFKKEELLNKYEEQLKKIEEKLFNVKKEVN